MSIDLPAAINAYITAANIHDADAAASCFLEEATIRDEGREHRGSAAIRAWVEQTSKQYNPKVVLTRASEAEGKLIAVGHISGDFPGSPIRRSRSRYGT